VVAEREGDTIATVIGPLPVVVLSAVLVAVAWALERSRRRRTGPTDEPDDASIAPA